MKKAILLTGILLLLLDSQADAWKDGTTHPTLTLTAVENSMLDSILKERLSLPQGIETRINGKEEGAWFNNIHLIREWLQEGAMEEDHPMCRASNHFLNPYEPWASAGLTDTADTFLIGVYCWGFGLGQYPFDNISSNLTWATGYISPSDFDFETMDFNNFDWDSARHYFYKYLAGGRDDNGDEIAPGQKVYLAKTFRALGQVMHLLQDVAVPAHVRDDFSQGHTMFQPDLHQRPKDWIGNGFELYVHRNNNSNPWFDLPLIRPGFNLTRITDLWDTNQLSDTYEPSNMSTLGLAEYASMNFLSEYRMFNSNSCFPFPSFEHCVVEASDPPWETNTPLERQYLASVNGHPGERIHHLAIVSYLKYFTKDNYLPNVSTDKIPLYMDENCYNEYAEKLIPRAIGYSSQLLDYFFRGNLDIKKAYFTYGADASISGMGLEFKNISSPLESGQEVEPLAGGQIDLVYRYLPPGEKANAAAEQRPPVFSYGVAQDIYTVADETDPINSEYVIPQQNIVFTRPIAAGSEEISFKLVYLGTLGNEPNAVFAATQNKGAQIAYYLQPGGTGNPSIIQTILPDGQQGFTLAGPSEADTWYLNPTWDKQGDRLAFEKLQCYGDCVVGQLNENITLDSDIVVLDMASEAIFPQNELATFHLSGAPLLDCDDDSYVPDLPLTSPSFSPQGDRFVAIAGGIGEVPLLEALVVIDVETGQWHYPGGCDRWSHYGSIIGSAPAWNPQDDTIAFYRSTSDDSAGTGWDGPSGSTGGVICLINADGSSYAEITAEGFLDTQPAWSPDGKWLAFVSNRATRDRLELWIMDRDGHHMRKIYGYEGVENYYCSSPSFSPDGLRIAFRQQPNKLYSIDIWGNNLAEISQSNALSPEWSPALDPPTAQIDAAPETLHSGESTTLTWTCSHGQSAEIDNGIGAVDPSGSVTVTATQTTTYTLSVTGLGGTSEDSVTVTVE